LHEKGFEYGGRRFKLFTFSRLFGHFRRVHDELVFHGPVTFYVSSPVEKFINEVASSLVKKGVFSICGEELPVREIHVLEKPFFDERLIFRTLSPITVYSTLMKADGSKKTYYYSPYESEFNELLKRNLMKKASILHKRFSEDFKIIPLNRKKCREVIVKYKGTVIKAWEGIFKVKGDPELLEVMYDAGLGSKNSAGFGMMEVVPNCSNRS